MLRRLLATGALAAAAVVSIAATAPRLLADLTGKFVHAPSSGGKVRVEAISTGYWSKRFNGARRLIDEGSTPSAGAFFAMR